MSGCKIPWRQLKVAAVNLSDVQHLVIAGHEKRAVFHKVQWHCPKLCWRMSLADSGRLLVQTFCPLQESKSNSGLGYHRFQRKLASLVTVRKGISLLGHNGIFCLGNLARRSPWNKHDTGKRNFQSKTESHKSIESSLSGKHFSLNCEVVKSFRNFEEDLWNAFHVYKWPD